MTTTHNSIHKQQLFHWIGRHIDIDLEKGSIAKDEVRARYLKCLLNAFEQGLWCKTPNEPDQLGDGSLIKVHRPITCFTEWSLGQSLPHTAKYGRLGLGFPKRFILERGGQPVTYCRDLSKNDPYSTALKKVAKFLHDAKSLPSLKRTQLQDVLESFQYLSHFAKRIKKSSTLPLTASTRDGKGATKKKRRVLWLDPYVRKFGSMLHYLEEREWRIVYDVSLAKHFTTNSDATSSVQYFLKFIPGNELFTVVLPDNHTVHMAIENSKLRKHIYPNNAPHVTLLSLNDIGTF